MQHCVFPSQADATVSTYTDSMKFSNKVSSSGQSGSEEFDGGTAVACVILGLSFLVGAPGNLLVIWTILRHIKQHSHTVVLILHLAVADLLVLITLPLWIYSLAFSWVFGEAFCKAMVYIINACMYSSVFLITVLGVEHFVAVRYPFTSTGWKSQKAFHKLILALWISAVLFSILVIQTQVVGKKAGEEHCLYTSTTQVVVIVLLQTPVGYILPSLSLWSAMVACAVARVCHLLDASSHREHTLIILATENSFSDMAECLESIRSTMIFIPGAMVFISSTNNPVLYMFAARSFRNSRHDTGIQKLFRHLSSTSQGEGNKELSFVSKHHSRQTRSSECVTKRTY